jgi:hypothetical protein
MPLQLRANNNPSVATGQGRRDFLPAFFHAKHVLTAEHIDDDRKLDKSSPTPHELAADERQSLRQTGRGILLSLKKR